MAPSTSTHFQDPQLPTYTLTLYIAFGLLVDPAQQRHWTFIIQHPESHRCTFYHTTGGPTTYKTSIERNQTLSDPRLSEVTRIGTVSATMRGRVTGILFTVRPQRCHTFILEVLAGLERERVIAVGWAAYFASCSDAGVSVLQQVRAERRVELGVRHLPHGVSRRVVDSLVEIARGLEKDDLSELDYCRCFF
ncbi:uncharacterized protein DSM5745_04499 [Aspergillus mulundensis]|uniref:Uncharacterized protein n=1 Tax=Aspergillus mulundensis TaxID=1810919 RepID=A0A3D8SCZ3_9EURO|nr:hypothetical protein DSM5745_04499 [Aspergillus mulundensis]RDW84173.1 hypothetical protein DSM5745_04499 [Aspergillus mulundensis]